MTMTTNDSNDLRDLIIQRLVKMYIWDIHSPSDEEVEGYKEELYDLSNDLLMETLIRLSVNKAIKRGMKNLEVVFRK